MFGYDSKDNNFDIGLPPKSNNLNNDFLIAACKINIQTLAKGTNGFVRGEFTLNPPENKIVEPSRSPICTNDYNIIWTKYEQEHVLQPFVILEAQMTMEVSIGLVGCNYQKLTGCFSRLYCMLNDSDAVIAVFRAITEINQTIGNSNAKEKLLTGWAIDTGDWVYLFIEGPQDGPILSVWEMTDDYRHNVKTFFSTAARYSNRLYAGKYNHIVF